MPSRRTLEFDDSWMENTPQGGYSVIGEYMDDDDVLERMAARETESVAAHTLAVTAVTAPQATTTGDKADMPINASRPTLEFDDTWMEDTSGGGHSVIGEYKDDDDVLERMAEREAEQIVESAAAATLETAEAPTA